MIEINMIVHLTCNKGICTFADSIVQQEVACSATDGHTLNRTLQQFVALCTLYTKLTLDQLDEVLSRQSL